MSSIFNSNFRQKEVIKLKIEGKIQYSEEQKLVK